METTIEYVALNDAAQKEAANIITTHAHRRPEDPTDDPREAFVIGAEFGAEWAGKRAPSKEQLYAAARALYELDRASNCSEEEYEAGWKATEALYALLAKTALEAAAEHPHIPATRY